jgi:RHS repeat-associated protein
MGKLSAQSRPYKPGDTPVWTNYSYDGLGRTLKVIAPDGFSTTTYSYAANTVTVTDPAGKQKTFTLDAFGNLSTVVEPDASQTNTSNQATTNYTYDALNHLTNVSMPRRMPSGSVVTQTRTFNYVFNNRIGAYLLSATNPESGTVSYGYNSDGTLGSKTDAMGQTLNYARDSYGRVLTVSLGSTVLRTYTYDTNSVDNTFSQYSNGRVTTLQYNVPAISTTYDNNNNQINFTGDTVIEMYSYTSPGQVAAKRLRVTRADSLNETLTADLNGSWTYNNEGKPTGVSYPGDPNGNYPPPSYSYSYDGMGRLAGMSETAPSNYTFLSGVTYNAAGQMTQMGNESRTYNVMGQLTNVHNGTFNITYNYSATQNNGKITSQVDNLTGEQVTYAYDSLNRLISAQAGSTWGQGFAYDPFGNLTDKTALAGSVPTMHIVPDATTNHLGGEDANGNPPGQMDAESRLIITGTQRYAYDAQNKRVWSCTASGTNSWMPCTFDTYYFYGPNGKLMTQFTPVYTLAYTDQQNVHHPATFTFQNSSNTRAYFGGRMLGDEDRLGSRGGKYFPYGDDRSNPPPANDAVKFATYTRDSATGLDYADQRYYNSTYGRFASPDQYVASGGPSAPESWNRYTYVGGDPMNYFDPVGNYQRGPEDPDPGTPSPPGPTPCVLVNGEPVCPGPTPTDPPDDQPDDGECDIQVKHATLKELGPVANHFFVHTYLVVTIGGTSEVLEGIADPSPTNGFLNAYHSPSGSLQDDDPAHDSLDFDAKTDTSLTNQEICRDAVLIREAERAFEKNSNNTIAYSLRGKKNPNSNSFARYLLGFAPNLGKVHHARRAVGWSTLIFGR